MGVNDYVNFDPGVVLAPVRGTSGKVGSLVQPVGVETAAEDPVVVCGNNKFDPGLVLAKSVDAWTVWGKPAAEDPVLVSCNGNFDPGAVLENPMDPGTRRVEPAAGDPVVVCNNASFDPGVARYPGGRGRTLPWSPSWCEAEDKALDEDDPGGGGGNFIDPEAHEGGHGVVPEVSVEEDGGNRNVGFVFMIPFSDDIIITSLYFSFLYK